MASINSRYPPLLCYMGRLKKQNKYNFLSKYWFAIEEEWNKMFEEFILKTCKSFRRRVDTIIERKKNVGHIE